MEPADLQEFKKLQDDLKFQAEIIQSQQAIIENLHEEIDRYKSIAEDINGTLKQVIGDEGRSS